MIKINLVIPTGEITSESKTYLPRAGPGRRHIPELRKPLLNFLR